MRRNPKLTVTNYLEMMGEEFKVESVVEVTNYGCPAKLFGPPENCWPEEPAEYDVLAITLQTEGRAPWTLENTAQFWFLVEKFDEQVLEAIFEDKAEADYERFYSGGRGYDD